jgi:hypothetical protein
MAVRARGSTGWTTSSSSSRLPEVRFESDRSRFAVLSVRVRCIFKFEEAMLLRCRTEACSFELATTSCELGQLLNTYCSWSV